MHTSFLSKLIKQIHLLLWSFNKLYIYVCVCVCVYIYIYIYIYFFLQHACKV